MVLTGFCQVFFIVSIFLAVKNQGLSSHNLQAGVHPVRSFKRQKRRRAGHSAGVFVP